MAIDKRFDVYFLDEARKFLLELSNQFRMLAFWDKTQNALVIATHGFIKKSQKTPLKEIEKAEQIMRKYYMNLKYTTL